MSCCNAKFIPLGSPNCNIDLTAIRGMIFVESNKVTYNAQGLPNNLNTLINNGDAVASPKVLNFTSEKPESTFQEFDDGTRYFIRESTRSFSFIIAKPTFWQLGAFKRLRCKKIGVYLIDKDNNMLGKSKFLDTANFEPITIENETIDAIIQFATDTTIRQLSISMQMSNLVKEEDLAVLQPDDNLIDPLSYINNPLTAVICQQLIINLTASTITVRLLAGNNNALLTPLTDDDFTGTITFPAFNVTTSSNVTITANTPTYNPLNQQITFNIISAPGVSVGNTVQVTGAQTPASPYAPYWSNKPQTVVI